jgi:hypothetical protein
MVSPGSIASFISAIMSATAPDPIWVLETMQSHVREGAIALLRNHDQAIAGSDEDMTFDKHQRRPKSDGLNFSTYPRCCRIHCIVDRGMEISMKTLKFALMAVGLVTTMPAFAQTAGGTQNTGPQGTGNFVAGKPEGNGNFVAGQTARGGTPVAGKPEGNGNFVAGKPKDPAK